MNVETIRFGPAEGSARGVWLPSIRAGSGADVYTVRLAEALGKRGIPAAITWFPHVLELLPFLARREPIPSNTGVIHATSAFAFAFTGRGVPVVTTEHHYPLDPGYRPFKSVAQDVYHRLVIGPMLKRSYRSVQAVIVDSFFTRDVLFRCVGVEAACVIPLWVDYDVFTPEPRVANDERRFRLLYVGNSSRRKGTDVIPELASRLGPGFVIACTAGLRAADSEHETEGVELLGRLSTNGLLEQYAMCDAVLVPSRYEGFGYVALEAMACGRPVVGFGCAAVSEVVRHDVTGLLSRIDDIASLTEDCRRLASSPSTVAAMGAAGRRRAVEHFSEEKAVDAYLEVYRYVTGSTMAS